MTVAKLVAAAPNAALAAANGVGRGDDSCGGDHGDDNSSRISSITGCSRWRQRESRGSNGHRRRH